MLGTSAVLGELIQGRRHGDVGGFEIDSKTGDALEGDGFTRALREVC